MKILKGISGSPGIAQGKVVLYKKSSGGGEGGDKLSLSQARARSIEKTQALYEKALEELGEEEAKIFSAYSMILEDEMLFAPIMQAVDGGLSEQEAVSQVIGQMSSILERKGNDYTKQRANDIRYVGDMLLAGLNGQADEWSLPEGDEKVILAAEELTPVDTMQLDTKRLAGLVTKAGGVTSHTVILAKSLGIPAVVAVHEILEYEDYPVEGFLDGGKGELILAPDEKTQMDVSIALLKQADMNHEIGKLKSVRPKTEDGENVFVAINIGSVEDMNLEEGTYYDGVGLMRSEFLFLMSDEKPSFEMQRNAYEEIINKAWPNDVIIRTLDVGGDKEIPYLSLPKEENPFLGNRGIRLCLRNSELFVEQLASILAAADGKRVKIMLPMVSSIGEIQEARKMLDRAGEYLDKRGIPHKGEVLLGIMVETPASAIMAAEFAKYCDFMSIGTNDLIQYVTCTDRGNGTIQQLYSPYHPAVIRLIANTIREGESQNVPVSVCGDMAGDLRFTKLLLGIGLRRFSVPAPMLGKIKLEIKKTNLVDARKTAERVLLAGSRDEVKAILEVKEGR